MIKYLLALLCVISCMGAKSAPMQIYLCLGQSNMEGYGDIEDEDLMDLPQNFKVMSAVDFSDGSRSKYGWYAARPPLVRESSNLSVADWFGRTMAENQPDVEIGLVCVAIGGARIEYLNKSFRMEEWPDIPEWQRALFKEYGDYPYGALVDCAKRAKEKGVIKGIVLHQGEANFRDPEWPGKVKELYADLLSDLDLDPAEVPLLLGEGVRTEQGGQYGIANGMMADLPGLVPTAHVITSAGLPHKGDRAHFTSESYRVLGSRYAEAMLCLLGVSDYTIKHFAEVPEPIAPNPDAGDYEFDFATFNPQIYDIGEWDAATGEFVNGSWGFGGWEYGAGIDLSGYKYIVAELAEPQRMATALRIYDQPNYWGACCDMAFNDGTLVLEALGGLTAQSDEVGARPLDLTHVYRVGFRNWGGKTPIVIKRVYATNSDLIALLSDCESYTKLVYSLQGYHVPAQNLSTGIYIVNGKKQYLTK